MNLSRPFIRRPVATTLLTLGLALAGICAFFVLPVSPLPQLESPSFTVTAALPGASPDTLAASVATPLERRLGVISGLTEMTSVSSVGTTRISLQFDLNRKADAVAREVQAAINASRADLPASLRTHPTYRNSNPADAPVMILALTSSTRTPGEMFDEVSKLVLQKLSQLEGVGDVEIGGASLPAVRVELLPYALNRYGVSLEDIRAALQSTQSHRPKGSIETAQRSLQIYAGDVHHSGNVHSASDYAELVVAWRDGTAIRLNDVARVFDGVEDRNTLGLFNGQPAVIVLITRQPGANVIQTVDSVRALLPQLQAMLPHDVSLQVASERTQSIRASLHDIELTLLISLVLVILVVSAFLRSLRATVIPAVATIVSLLGTFCVMHLMGFSLNNLSLMALTVATGFVVDDAIVVLENTSRHIDAGMSRYKAALLGAREVGFTVVSISVSLVAVFIPLLFMGDPMGRLFREFAVTLSAAVLISLVISLTTTPMMCAWWLRPDTHTAPEGRWTRACGQAHAALRRMYARSLDWALACPRWVLAVWMVVIGLNLYLFQQVPKGFFPKQDTGQISAGLRADQSISFQAMHGKLKQLVDVIRADPAVDTVVGFTGGRRAGGGFMFINLKPARQRTDSGRAVIARLRPQLAQATGVRVFLNQAQDLRMGGRSSNSTYQYTLKADNMADLKRWSGRLVEVLKQDPGLLEIDTDLTENGVETFITVDHDSAARMGLSSRDINNALYDAFGQRQVATLYGELNQYRVVMEVAPRDARSPQALNDIELPVRSVRTGAMPGLRDPSSALAVNTAAQTMVPLSAFATYAEKATATLVSHQDAELANTLSFNLADGYTLEQARAAIVQAEADIGMPTNVRGSFEGTAKLAQSSQQQQLWLILASVVVIYLVLGILYESLLHPITVLSTLPSAGLGAMLALMLLKMEFSLIALIGLLLLIGLVMKNAILIIDFAIEAERSSGLTPIEAARLACLQRFRPILMTTLAAGLGALPLAIGLGEGSELRQPLGVTIIGGLIVSQVLTLLTTPVLYVLLAQWRMQSRPTQALGPLVART